MTTLEEVERELHRLRTVIAEAKADIKRIKRERDSLLTVEQQKQRKPPSQLKRVANYARALARWKAAGQPERTSEEVQRLRLICESNECGYFDGTVCIHSSCGCPVSRPGRFGDKLKWATESCPVGRWR